MYLYACNFFCCSCGLAVLAMAARPVLTCEVAFGGAPKDGGATQDGTDKQQCEIQSAMCCAINEAQVENKPWPRHYPPNLSDLQKQAIMMGVSGRGEMFSACTLANLAAEHQCGRYKVCLINQSLLNTENKNSENSLNKDVTKKSSFGNHFDGNNFVNKHLLLRQPTNAKSSSVGKTVRTTYIEPQCKSSLGVNGRMSNNIFHHNIDNDNSLNSPQTPSCVDSHGFLTLEFDKSNWHKSVVSRLMAGHLVAVW